MSPVDSFSPVPGTVDAYTGFTPYSTTSPAYAAGAGMTAASPLSTALAHGSRILSGIQASPFYHPGAGSVPFAHHQGRSVPGIQQAPQQPQRQSDGTPQQGSPEYLKAALQHLQTTLLARLESDAEAFFDAVDGAAAVEADSKLVTGKAAVLRGTMDEALGYLEKCGLASVPLLPLPLTTDGAAGKEAGGESASIAGQGAEPTSTTVAAATDDQTGATSTAAITSATEATTTTKETEVASSHLSHQIELLQQQARDLFDRRQRLKESASIVGGILDS